MAERRMFSKSVIDTDLFLSMPAAAQALYFHLAMRADDDGFVGNPRAIQKMVNASDDDAKILMAKKFIIAFDTGVVVIRHWRIHNYIRGDRYAPTVFQDEKNSLEIVKMRPYECFDTSGRPRVGKDRLGKDRLGETDARARAEEAEPEKQDRTPYEKIRAMYNELCTSLPKCNALSDMRKRQIHARFEHGQKLEDFETVFRKAQASKFLTGGGNRGWKANFDWIIRDSNFVKILDGNFDDQRIPQGADGFGEAELEAIRRVLES